MVKLRITDDDEVDARLRRLETRITKLMEFLGFDIQAVKPVWKNGRINVSSVGTPLAEILHTIPKNWDDNEDVEIYHRGKFVAIINRSQFVDETTEENENVEA